eukprot:Nitzschia sp. Nitz4//scaffold137_size62074//21789//23414//NITZ4_006413-RA/size62074-processed-gene-0.84-mRNA-1//-1//CDS//3329535694//8931//frame0
MSAKLQKVFVFVSAFFFISKGAEVCQPKSQASSSENGPLLEGACIWEDRVPPTCSLVMAQSGIPNAGWGVFTLNPLKRGDSLPHSEGDIVVHMPDFDVRLGSSMRRLIWEYLWDGQELHGQYEGQHVMSFVPGIGMLANGAFNLHNVLPLGPDREDPRGSFQLATSEAGSRSNYQNLTWVLQRDVAAGSEILVNFGKYWFQERGFVDPPQPPVRSPKWLRQNGYCIDNIRVGESTVTHAGRGAFATRDLEGGSIVSPVPVLPLSTVNMKMKKEHESGGLVETEQLVQNYCFGHPDSSLMLFPYAPGVHAINHALGRKPNVKLRWAVSSQELLEQKNISVLQDSSTQLMLELVALRPIQESEEIFLDYGSRWEQAWRSHVEDWLPSQSTKELASAIEWNETTEILRTDIELRNNPYPSNLFTSCFYRYEGSGLPSSGGRVPTWVWKETRGLPESRFLRPCHVIDRVSSPSTGEIMYTVSIWNRPGLVDSEKIPRGAPHIVTGVSRKAIQFSTKIYTSDQHLENAFRHGIDMDVFPEVWKDLL